MLRFRTGASVLLLQHAPGWVVEIVELPLLHRPEEEQGKESTKQDRDGQEEEQSVHGSPSRTMRSTRNAPQITRPLESGISSAATSGLTSPAAAADTATTL